MSSSPNLAELLAKISDGVCVLGPDSRVSFVNEKASQILDAADDDFQSKIAQTVMLRDGARFEHFHPVMNRWFEHQTYTNADGGMTLISRDITSRHRVEEALRASEERFRRVIDSNIIGVIVMENGVITESNDVFLKMVGYTRADLVKQQLDWRRLTPAEFEPADTKARQELEATGVFSPYEKEFIHAAGRRVPILIGGVATRTLAHTRETLCLALDLSERRRAEERLRSIVECGKILASSLECEKTFPELAQFAVSRIADSCAIYVYEDNQLIQMAAAHSVPLFAEAERQADLMRVMATAQAELMMAPISRALVPIVTGNEVAGVLAMSSAREGAFEAEDLRLFEVIGRRAGLALQSARLYRETQRANRLKDEFVAVVSHELRTPLTPILGGVYMLRNDPRNEQIVARALDLIERNAKAQVRIVDDLLDVSRALSGKLRLSLEPVDLASVIEAAVETARPASLVKRIPIDVRLGSVSGVVSGDANRLQQVVWNLVANSVKFTPEGGEIVVELVETPGHAEIRVTDTGIGIQAEFLPHVFEKFRQADTSRTRVHGGLGLGLAIVRHLVESHGGTVRAQSPGEEQGSTFIVKLPLRDRDEELTTNFANYGSDSPAPTGP